MANTVARITEISARSDESFDDAIRAGVSRAHATLRNVQGAWVKEMKVDCSGGEITSYQVMMQITFVLDD